MNRSVTRPRRACALGVLLCSLTPFLWVSPAAAASWSAPSTLTTSPGNLSGPGIALDPKGNALASWGIFDFSNDSFCCFRTQTAFRPSGGSFEGPVTVSEPGHSSGGAQILFDGKGNALAVWSVFGGLSRIEAAFRPAGGSFGPPRVIPDPRPSFAPRAAMDHKGNTLLVWTAVGTSGRLFDTQIHASFRPAGGDFGPVQALSTPDELINFRPDIAMDRQGNAIVSWEIGLDVGQQCCSEIRFVRRPAGGSFGPTETLSEPGQNLERSRIVMNARGDAMLVWHSRDASSSSCCVRTLASFQPPGGNFGEPQTIVNASRSGGIHFDVGLDGKGGAVVVWRSSPAFPDMEIQAALRPPRGTFGPPVTLSETCRPEDVDFLLPQVAVNSKGDAVVAWSLCGPIQAALRPAKGSFGLPENISSAEPFQFSFDPDLAIDDKGNATAMWLRGFSGGLSIETAFHPAH